MMVILGFEETQGCAGSL